MLKQTINYTDFNGQPRVIEEYFHLNEDEIVELQLESEGGIQEEMQEAVKSNDVKKLLDFIKKLVHRSYGKKTPDGIYFDKTPELLHRFVTSAYYSDFLYGLLENDGAKGQAFVEGIMPKKLIDRATAKIQGQASGGEFDQSAYGLSARETFAAAQEVQKNDQIIPEPDRQVFGQPSYPRVNQQPEPTPTTPQMTPEQWQQFQQWQAQQEAGVQGVLGSNQPSSAPASPDAFQLPRPPHEQTGDAQ